MRRLRQVSNIAEVQACFCGCQSSVIFSQVEMREGQAGLQRRVLWLFVCCILKTFECLPQKLLGLVRFAGGCSKDKQLPIDGQLCCW